MHIDPHLSFYRASGDADRVRPYLPVDKQYLITRNVPCLRRVKALEADHEDEVEVEGMEQVSGSVAMR